MTTAPISPASSPASTASIPTPLSPALPATLSTAQPMVIQMMPSPKLEWYEGPGFIPAIAAIIAVTISYFGLQSSTKKQIEAAALRSKEQFDHSINEAQTDRDYTARQASLDRLQQARQEIYVQLIDDYMAVLGMVGSMPMADFEEIETPNPIQKMGASVNKTWLLSEVQTAYVVRNFFSDLSEMHMRMVPRAAWIITIRKRISELREQAKQADADHRTAIEQHTERSKHSVRFDRPVQELLDDPTVRGAAKLISEINKKIAAAEVERSNLHMAYLRSIADEQAALTSQLNEVMAAARRESGQTEDIEILIRQSDEMTRRVNAALSAFTGQAETKPS